MAVEDVIAEIERLNSEGIALTQATQERAADYKKALKLHQKAAELSQTEDVHPNYYAISMAGIGYAMRQSGADAKETLDLLVSSINETEARAKSQGVEVHFGLGRLKEEQGLVFIGSNGQLLSEKVVELGMAVTMLDKAVNFYDKELALRDEVMKSQLDDGTTESMHGMRYTVDANGKLFGATREQVIDRKLRTLGITSTVYTELSRVDPGARVCLEIKIHYLKRALKLAQKELDGRLSLKGPKDSGLMNSYHTIACAQSELTAGNKKMYEAAKGNLEQAKQLAQNPVVQTVLALRSAWLEYVHNPNNKDAIMAQVDDFLQRNETAPLNPNHVTVLKDQMQTLSQHLKGKYLPALSAVYRK